MRTHFVYLMLLLLQKSYKNLYKNIQQLYNFAFLPQICKFQKTRILKKKNLITFVIMCHLTLLTI